MVVSFIFLILVQHFAKIIVWTFILAFILFLLIGGAMLAAYYVYITNPSALPASVTAKASQSAQVSQLNSKGVNLNNILGGSIVLFLSAILMIVLVICNCAKINLAIGIIEASGEFVLQNKKIVFLPLLAFIVIFGYFMFWIAGMIYLYSCGTI